ncbi:MAG TPA: molybdenum cofactor guanylyltransferase MobA [Candidatus Sulfotelmatobacter sp.]|jgi:molybdopterin-guanine dinucleotide biosynthesis protein A|nr:molybdenum cofactor guanylyltransferase MobA [Candidatus Sulfotelmatobacter sp.]
MIIAGIILAGGQARRLGGGDKPLRLLAGRPILARLIASFAPKVSAMAISANGDPARFAAFGLPVLADPVPGHPGPLAGLLAGLEWAGTLPDVKALLTLPGDTPFLPDDLADRLGERVEAGAGAAVASSGGRRHPVAGLWPLSLAASLRRFLVDEGERKVGLWAERAGAATVEWSSGPVDPFFNINHPDDLALAERLATGCGAAADGNKGCSGHG